MRHPLFVTLLTLAACAAEPEALDTCPDLPTPEGDVVTTTLPIALVAGDEPLALGDVVQTAQGVPFRVQKLRMYVSEAALLRDDGSHEPALLVDADEQPLAYGVDLVDAADPEALALRLRAPRGDYAGLRLTIGVPATCPDGEARLNHADASVMQAPLDVDSDMYWSWDPGYVFLKIEGRVGADGVDGFFYHVGDDDRTTHVTLDGPVDVDDGVSTSTIAFDVPRLFVSPDGEATPRLDGDTEEREVHGGPPADQLHRNLEGSNVLELR
jgi:hypothetical protein